MLKIKAQQTERRLVQELAAEYISGKFHELKGDYEHLNTRFDALIPRIDALSSIDDIKKSLMADIELEKKAIADMKTDLRNTIDALNDELGQVQHRLEDVEDHLGI